MDGAHSGDPIWNCLILRSSFLQLGVQAGATATHGLFYFIDLSLLGWGSNLGSPACLEKHSIIQPLVKIPPEQFPPVQSIQEAGPGLRLRTGGGIRAWLSGRLRHWTPHFSPPSSHCGLGAPPRVRPGLSGAEPLGQWAELRLLIYSRVRGADAGTLESQHQSAWNLSLIPQHAALPCAGRDVRGAALRLWPLRRIW